MVDIVCYSLLLSLLSLSCCHCLLFVIVIVIVIVIIICLLLLLLLSLLSLFIFLYCHAVLSLLYVQAACLILGVLSQHTVQPTTHGMEYMVVSCSLMVTTTVATTMVIIIVFAQKPTIMTNCWLTNNQQTNKRETVI